jgi:RNA polymerase sigma-70 factor (ECF subfamily)
MASAGPYMNTTSIGLLERLKHAKPNASEWRKLRDIYLPMIRHWLSRLPILRHEVDDVTQEVLVVLFRELPSFERRRDGSFRAWLRQITVNRMRAFCKTRRKQPLAIGGPETDQLLAQLDDPTSDLARQWDQDHDKHVFQKLLAIVERDFAPSTWQAFTRFAMEGQPAAEVARELGLTESAVVQAKFRILKRLREEAGELLD